MQWTLQRKKRQRRINEGEEASDSGNNNVSSTQSKSSDGRSNWDEVVQKLLKKSKTVELNQEKDTNVLP